MRDIISNIKKSDLRVVKTAKLLNVSMFSLLERQSFKKTTVRDICEEAQISRATFYARFTDKYDFLKSWLINLIPDGFDANNTYEQNEKIHNDHFYKNKLIIKNLLTDTDNETLDILAEFILTYFMQSDKSDRKQMTTEQVVLTNFFAGGMIYYIFWQVKNKFPPGISPMNAYLYELVNKFREWKLDIL